MNLNNDSCVEGSGKNPYSILYHKEKRWARDQGFGVNTLFDDCLLSDPFGNSFQPLDTIQDIKSSTFRKCKKILIDAGLFEFKAIHTPNNPSKVLMWSVKNLMGTRTKFNREKSMQKTEIIDDVKGTQNDTVVYHNDTVVYHNDTVVYHNDTAQPETLTEQPSCNPSLMISINKPINKTNKEINNTSLLSEKIYIKPDLDHACVREEKSTEAESQPKKETIAEKLARISREYSEGKYVHDSVLRHHFR